jgi:uncharacterized protein YndB with AHSA1/START domain
MSSTIVHRHLKASRAKVYQALLDAKAVAVWLAPPGMSSEIHAFDPRQGGSFRISLTHDAPAAMGKTSARTDTHHGHFVRLVANERIVEVIEFETAEASLQGKMTVTMTLSDADGGTVLLAVHDGLPPGLSAADNEIGWTASLGKLAALVEVEERNRSEPDPDYGDGSEA